MWDVGVPFIYTTHLKPYTFLHSAFISVTYSVFLVVFIEKGALQEANYAKVYNYTKITSNLSIIVTILTSFGYVGCI